MNSNGHSPQFSNPNDSTTRNQIKRNESKTFSIALSHTSSNDTKIRKQITKKPIDFYAMFTRAIQKNEDQLVNQKKCLEELNKAKIEEEAKRKPKKAKQNKPRMTIQSTKAHNIEDQSVINDIQYHKAKNEKLFGSLYSNKDGDDNPMLQSHDSNYHNMGNTQHNNNSNDDAKALKDYQKKKIKERRRKVMQSALVFLESNSIFVADFIKKNPFQDAPYQLKYSFEFIEAVKFGEYDLVKSALQMNINFLFSYDYFKQTGYHWAAKLGNHKILNLLLTNGKHCNQFDNQNRTPLYLAAINNHYDCCVLLLNNYANPFLADINMKKPVDVSTDKEIYLLISNYMDTPYSNPIIKKKMNNVIKELELKKMVENNIKSLPPIS